MRCTNDKSYVCGLTSAHTFLKQETWPIQRQNIDKKLFSIDKDKNPEKFQVAEMFSAAVSQIEINGVPKTIDVAVFQLCKNLLRTNEYELGFPRTDNVPGIFSGCDHNLIDRKVYKRGMPISFFIQLNHNLKMHAIQQ